MTTILRRLIGALLLLVGLAVLVFGGWFARALGTDGAATFTTRPPAGLPVVIDASTNARTDIPLTITATAADDVPITISVARPSDAQALLGTSRYARVTGIDVREWHLLTEHTGTTDPIAPANADLWRSQQSSSGTATIEGDLENAPETMIITTAPDQRLTSLEMTWTNPAWFYQALSLIFAGVLLALVGLALVLRRTPRAAAPEAAPATQDQPEPTGTEVAR
ncbi:MAG TPA: hypothetical protein GXZ60_00285 [Intrasporangiaceae bacterium]|nr:hypothetical protein [Intrasporangiaceae bacterium]